jgi:uncharacterized protein YgiM (DUF1202 family)
MGPERLREVWQKFGRKSADEKSPRFLEACYNSFTIRFFRRFKMTIYLRHIAVGLLVAALFLGASACKDRGTVADPKDLPDLNSQTFPYVTVQTTRVRTGPGTQFRAMAEIGPNARVNVVGRDGDWVLIVSKKGNAPGFVEIATVKPSDGESKESLNPQVEGKYESIADTQVRSGRPPLSSYGQRNKLNVVDGKGGRVGSNANGHIEAGLPSREYATAASELRAGLSQVRYDETVR